MAHTNYYSAGAVAEQVVRTKLQSLPKGYRVFQNVDAGTGETFTELDFAVVTPTGALVLLEVKAGDLQSDDQGELNRHYANGSKSITHQIHRQNMITRMRLSELSGRLNMFHFLVLPQGKVIGSAIGIDRSHVIDADRIAELPEIIRDCNLKRTPLHDNIDRDRLIAFLENRLTVKHSIASICDMIDARNKNTVSQLATWVPRISSPLQVVEVSAPAGSGKTQLALELLENAVTLKESVWYINSTRLIVERQQQLPINTKVDFIGTWHELALDKLNAVDPSEIDKEARGAYFEKTSQDLIKLLNSGKFSIDTIIVDDAHDFPIERISALYAALSPSGTLYALSDPNMIEQKVEYSESVKISAYESGRVPLKIEQAINALHLSSTPFVSVNDFEGNVPQFLEYGTTKGSLLKQTQAAVDAAHDEGFKDEQIAILTFKGREHSEILNCLTLGKRKYRLKRPTDQFKLGKQIFTVGELFCDSVRRFKGLQAPCVILTEVDFEDLGEVERRLLYLGFTRPSVALKVVISKRATEVLSKQLIDD